MRYKKSRLLTFISSTILISTLSVFSSFAAMQGHLDTVSNNAITGWAWDNSSKNKTVNVEITISGKSLGPSGKSVITIPAETYRSDLEKALGYGKHSFSYNIDWSKYDGSEFVVTAAAVSGNERIPLIGSHTFKKDNSKNSLSNKNNNLTAEEEAKGPGFSKVDTSENVSEKTSEKTNLKPNLALGPEYEGNSSLEITYKRPNGSNRGTVNRTTKTTSNKVNTSTSKNESSSSNKNNKNNYTNGEYLGKFTVSGYCNCTSCSGGYNKTYSGTIPKADHTISADLNIFPIGTKLKIGDIVYTVEDKGSGVKDNWLDIYFDTHKEAYDFGLQKLDVYYVKK